MGVAARTWRPRQRGGSDASITRTSTTHATPRRDPHHRGAGTNADPPRHPGDRPARGPDPAETFCYRDRVDFVFYSIDTLPNWKELFIYIFIDGSNIVNLFTNKSDNIS